MEPMKYVGVMGDLHLYQGVHVNYGVQRRSHVVGGACNHDLGELLHAAVVLFLDQLCDIPQDDHLVGLHVKDDLDLLDLKDLGAALLRPVIILLLFVAEEGGIVLFG